MLIGTTLALRIVGPKEENLTAGHRVPHQIRNFSVSLVVYLCIGRPLIVFMFGVRSVYDDVH